MIDSNQKQKLLEIWNKYEASQKVVLDVKGNIIPNIDDQRKLAIVSLKQYINSFICSETEIGEFKTLIDSFNKRNNLWGFTATKGQMFFNHLVKVSAGNEKELTEVIRTCIFAPRNIDDALKKIESLENYCQKYFKTAKDKRTVPNPSSVCYFLSYFWQISDHQKWPIMYTSLVESLKAIGLWQDFTEQKEVYRYFQDISSEIANILSTTSNRTVGHWEIEHAFWDFLGNPNKPSKPLSSNYQQNMQGLPVSNTGSKSVISSSLDLSEYIVPRVSKLVELGASSVKSSAEKGKLFEKMVAEIFKLMSFDVEELGQGTGRNPDSIIRHREDNTAFIVDAKAYTDGYSLGLDDRAIKEYINFHCPRLQKEGYKKIGFVIVSNSFKSDLDELANDITWNTDVKRFILLTSEALLYLLAYKTRDLLRVEQLVETIVSLGNPITTDKIVSQYEDV